MIKKILIILGYSIVFTILIVIILILTKNLFLDRLVYSIMKIRGTSNFEGEEKGSEFWNIIVGMIIPIIFLIILTVVVFFNRKRFGNFQNK